MPDPVTEFFPVSFSSQEEVGHFGMQLLNAADSPRGVQLTASGPRPVAFQSVMPRYEELAFLSAGAVKLLTETGARFAIDRNPVPLRELPDGLTLLIGDQRDYTEYKPRRE